MTVFVLVACLSSWSDYYEATDCQVMDVYREKLSAQIRAAELAEEGFYNFRKYRVLPFKVKK